MLKDVKELVIDRSKWRTGMDYPNYTGEGITALLNNKGFMCCLGFLCLAMGAKSDSIINRGSPAQVDRFQDFSRNNDIALSKAIHINDSPTARDLKEQKLIQLFRDELDIDLSFEGEYYTN